jgi:maltose alpha-D-glucosyltransferase/alpha-amylase
VRRVKTDYFIDNFEGDLTLPIAERREKHSPLKDVASMLRSFSYAAYAALIKYTARRPGDLERLEPWASLWEHTVGAEFLRAYRDTAQAGQFLPSERTVICDLLETYLLDKALKELHHEIRNRPTWTRIPLEGILSLSV